MHTSRLPITIPLDPRFIRGAVDVEQTPDGLRVHRLPAWARIQCQDARLAMAEAQPSGVRLAIETEATALELLVLPTKRVYRGFPPRPDGVYEFMVDGSLVREATVQGGNVLTLDLATGAGDFQSGAAQPLRFEGLPAGHKRIELWLPHDETTELVALFADAPVVPAVDAGKPRWIHHGSSISQGSNATRPTGTWPAVAAARAGLDLLNLGFGGSALLDPFVARTIRDLPADLISLKIGINLVNTDLMRMRAFGPAVHGFLDTIRDGHPLAPIFVVSPVCCPIHEDTPGPTSFDPAALAERRLLFRAAGRAEEVKEGKLTLATIREQLAAIVGQRRQTDPNIRYVDGLELYGPADSLQLPLPDALHPDAATHRIIGERFAERILADTHRHTVPH